MMKFAAAFAAGVAMSLAFAGVASAKDKTIAVSWKTFQEERWRPTRPPSRQLSRQPATSISRLTRRVLLRSRLPTSRA